MKPLKPIATVADLIVLVGLVLLNPLSPMAPPAVSRPHIADKVEVVVTQRPSADSLQRQLTNVSKELDELQYYFRVHHVTDEGYNLLAQYNTSLLRKRQQLLTLLSPSAPALPSPTVRLVKAKDRPLPAVKTNGGYWKAGRFWVGKLSGNGIVRDYSERVVKALWDCDTIVTALRKDSVGTYRGQMNAHYQAEGEGIYDGNDGSHYEGLWRGDLRDGFGFETSPVGPVRIGEWKGRFLGEKIKFSDERIYGIDISRHQHEHGRRRYGINWRNLRITSLGRRHDIDGQTFPVSFIYIKATEGTTIRNRYFSADYRQARQRGLHVGAYHFFSLRTTAAEQAKYFLRHAIVRKGDFPPVLDVEPTDKQIEQIGGSDELMRRIRTWLQAVESRTGMRPILYVSQTFINQHMANAADIKQKYNIWIARYGQYKPDVRLVYWQLCADGRVSGINGPVDINVFNGYQGQFDEFVRTGFHK